MKARETQRKTTATGGERKLKLSKETLQDLTPSGKQKEIKGGITQVCTGRTCSFTSKTGTGSGMLGGG